eukprot:675028-Amphidinium_carterae.1
MAYVNMLTTKSAATEEPVELEQLSEVDRIKLMIDPTFGTSSKGLFSYLVKSDEAYERYAFYAPGFTTEVCKHLNLHEVSDFEYDSDSDSDVLLWIHTNASIILNKLEDNVVPATLGQRTGSSMTHIP